MPYPERIEAHRPPGVNIAIALSTKDRVHLTEQMFAPLTAEGGYDLYWMDGSVSDAGKALPARLGSKAPQFVEAHYGVGGGPDAAIVYSLSLMLSKGYDYVGLIENDVLLSPGWFDALMKLFELGRADGLNVGGATVRPFDKRTLWRCRNYSVLFNAGAGMIMLSREGALTVLRHYRTSTAGEIRRTFQYAAGKDLALTWEFTGNDEHNIDVWPVSGDWYFESALAKEGYWVLGSTPGYADNIDANLEEALGIRVNALSTHTDEEDPAFRAWFEEYAGKKNQEKNLVGLDATYQYDPYNRRWIVYPHQLACAVKGAFAGKWGCVWNQRTGPFTAVALGEDSVISLPVFGPAKIVLSPDPGARAAGVGYEKLFPVREDRSVRYADAQDAVGKRVVQFGVRRMEAQKVTYYPNEVGARIEALIFDHPQPWMYKRTNFSFDDLKIFFRA